MYTLLKMEWKSVLTVLITNNGVEYFKVIPEDGNGVLSFEATKTSVETNPTANVPSTLKMVYTDMYGHDVVIELDMTVIPRWYKGEERYSLGNWWIPTQ